nr:hypothetical protein CFP56_52415 [Quercus suber]
MALAATPPAPGGPDEDETRQRLSRTDQQHDRLAGASCGCGAHVFRRDRRAQMGFTRLDWRIGIVILVVSEREYSGRRAVSAARLQQKINDWSSTARRVHEDSLPALIAADIPPPWSFALSWVPGDGWAKSKFALGLPSGRFLPSTFGPGNELISPDRNREDALSRSFLITPSARVGGARAETEPSP